MRLALQKVLQPAKGSVGACRKTTFLFKSRLCSWLTCLLGCLAVGLFSLYSNTSYLVDASLCRVAHIGSCLGRLAALRCWWQVKLLSLASLLFYRESRNCQEADVFKLPYNCSSSLCGYVLTSPHGSPQGNTVLKCRTRVSSGSVLWAMKISPLKMCSRLLFSRDSFKVLLINGFSANVFAFLLDTLSQAILAGWAPWQTFSLLMVLFILVLIQNLLETVESGKDL